MSQVCVLLSICVTCNVLWKMKFTSDAILWWEMGTLARQNLLISQKTDCFLAELVLWPIVQKSWANPWRIHTELSTLTVSQHNIFNSEKNLTNFSCADADGVRTSGLWISSLTFYQLSHPRHPATPSPLWFFLSKCWPAGSEAIQAFTKTEHLVVNGLFSPTWCASSVLSDSPPFCFLFRPERSLCAAYCVLPECSVQLVVCYVSLNCSLSVCLEGNENGRLATCDDFTWKQLPCAQEITLWRYHHRISGRWGIDLLLFNEIV